MPTPGVWYRIRNRNSSLILDVRGASAEPLTPVIQYHDTGQNNQPGQNNQQWQLIVVTSPPDTPEIGYAIQARHSGLVLDVFQAGVADGTPIIQFPNHNGGNQQWVIRRVPNVPNEFTISGVASNKVLDVPGGSLSEDTQVIIFTQNNGTNQHWEFIDPQGVPAAE